MQGAPPPPRATPTPSQPPRGARLPPQPSPRATPPLPPSSPAAAALCPGAQVLNPFVGDEQPPEFSLRRNREAQETRGGSPKDATESTKRKESKVKQRKEKPAKQKGQRALLQPVTEMNFGEMPPPLPPSAPSVLVPEFPLPSGEEQETRGRSTVDTIELTPVGTTTTTSTRKQKVSSLLAKQKDSRVQQRKEKLAKLLPQRPPVARPPPQPTSYSPDPKTAMAGQPHTLSPLEGAVEDTSISIGIDRGYAGASSDVYLSRTKRKESGEKQRNEPQAKRLRSPSGLVSLRLISPSIGIRIMLSPRLVSPSTTLANSTPGKKRRNRRGSPHLIKGASLDLHIFSAMLKCLNEWNLEHKVFSITLDNASNNNSFVSYLKENLVAKRLLLSQGNLLHYRCAAHVFNLIVQEGLQEASNIVSNIRDSVKYVKSSQGRKERFEKVIKEVRISTKKRPPLDVVTRWNSTYHMLKCASEYERAFEALAQEDTQYVHLPHISEWIMAQKLCNILDKFADATKILSGYKYPTASIYFHQIWDIKLLLEEELSNKDAMVRFMVHEMRKKLQKYWDLSFLQICVPVVLDPRFKLGFLEFRLPKIGGDYSSSTYFPQVKQTFKDLYDEYFLKWGHLVPEYAKPAVDEPNFGKNNPWADWGQHQNLNQRRRVSELDKYLEEETVSVDIEFDILEYWKMSSATYPVLARMARDILAIPASTVASESAFSSGEKIINEYRSRLTSDTVEALVCLQDWLRGSTSPDDIAGCIMGDEEDDEL